ncbi:MAG: glycosyltransferase family 39 protein, partial [Anaerolineae bacterium]
MPTHPIHPARRLWPVLLLLLLALALRLHRLAGPSLWYDEGVTAAISQRNLADLARWTADDIQPPLYYVLVAGWTRLAGASEWALRFPSVAAGLLTLPLLLALQRRLWRFASGQAIEIAPKGRTARRPPAWTRFRSAQADLVAERPFAPNSFGGAASPQQPGEQPLT